MKGVLAYSTISHLGLITMLLGMNSALALVAAVFHMMNHATFRRRCSWAQASSITRPAPVICDVWGG
jgi:NADH:ubiquinone oxidoreductase subunit 2 (subunit N)